MQEEFQIDLNIYILQKIFYFDNAYFFFSLLINNTQRMHILSSIQIANKPKQNEEPQKRYIAKRDGVEDFGKRIAETCRETCERLESTDPRAW